MDIWQIWIIAAIILFIIEVISPSFFAASIGLGCIVAGISAIFLPQIWLQLIIFSVGVLLGFIYIRPFVLKYLHRRDNTVNTNVDALIGRTAKVSVTIDNSEGQGRVMVDGDDWKAVSADDTVILQGEKVRILKIDSIILTVKKID
ncbi:MAG: NfeD family protein [Rikenellaceae bacterium]|nr:NfeD family protein [Rikenellaceae bacterium]